MNPEAPKLAKEMTAIVADDNKVTQMLHHKLLETIGFQIEVVGNGQEAIDVLSSGKNFDLILMDLDMPIKNGIEATRKIRAMGIKSMIIGVSTHSEEATIQEFKDAGIDYYEKKPLKMDNLASILHKLKHTT